MRHVAMGKSEISGPAYPDQALRAASIAAMGQRLAAAGPRTRLRLSERPTPPGDIEAPPAARELSPVVNLIAERSRALARETAPMPRRPWPAWAIALRRATLLGATAAGGFALVLLAQSPRWAAWHQKPSHDEAAAMQTTQDVLPATQMAASASIERFAELAKPPRAHISATPEPDPVTEKFADAPVAPAHQAARTEFATLSPERRVSVPASLHDRAALPHPARVAIRQIPKSLEPSYKVAVVHHELPRWLTEDRPTQPRVLVMSPPPHNLEPPAGAAATAQLAATVPEKPSPMLPPIPRHPRLVYASTNYPPPPPYYGYPYGYYQGPP